MSVEPHRIIQGAIITEESTIQTEAKGQYVFRVNPKANKNQIRDAVEELFDVVVVSVNTMNYRGKRGRRIRGNIGRRSSWKKAIVKLQEGDTIELM